MAKQPIVGPGDTPANGINTAL